LTANTCGKAVKTFAIEPLVGLLLAEPARWTNIFYYSSLCPVAYRPEVDLLEIPLCH
jgi:hypothetical protein